MRNFPKILIPFLFLILSMNLIMANGLETENLLTIQKNEGNGMISPGSIVFNDGLELSAFAKSNLIRLASDMRDFPLYKVVIKGNGSGGGATQDKAAAYVQSIMNFMSKDMGIPTSRFEIDYSGRGNTNTVTYSSGESESPMEGLQSTETQGE